MGGGAPKVVIHCDAGPYSKKSSMYSLSWSSLLAGGSEQESVFCIATWLQGQEIDHAEEALWPALAASLESMSRPADPLGFGAVLVGLKGDLEYYVNNLGWASYNSATPCGLCAADRGARAWNNPLPTAEWRDTIYSLEEYKHRYCLPNCHPLNLFEGITAYTVYLDLLHVLDHKGVTSLIVGNILWSVIQHRELAGTQARTLTMINEEICAFYAARGVQNRLPELNIGNLIDVHNRATSHPVLHGPGIKAANSRSIVPYILELATRLDTGSPETRHRRKVVEWLDRLYTVLYAADMFLSDDQKAEVGHCVSRISLHFTWLAQNAISQGRVAWNMTPKLHYMMHLPLQADLLNPRFVQNYREESFVGRVAAIYRSCSSGPHWATVQARALRKYLTGLQVVLGNLEAF